VPTLQTAPAKYTYESAMPADQTIQGRTLIDVRSMSKLQTPAARPTMWNLGVFLTAATQMSDEPRI